MCVKWHCLGKQVAKVYNYLPWYILSENHHECNFLAFYYATERTKKFDH